MDSRLFTDYPYLQMLAMIADGLNARGRRGFSAAERFLITHRGRPLEGRFGEFDVAGTRPLNRFIDEFELVVQLWVAEAYDEEEALQLEARAKSVIEALATHLDLKLLVGTVH